MISNQSDPVDAPRPRRRTRLALSTGAVITAGMLGLWGWRAWQNELPASLRYEAELASRRGRWQEVEGLSDRWIKLDPRNGEAWMMRARAAHEQHDVAGSAQILWEMPDECPQKLAALQMLAELQLGPLADPLAAERTFRRVLEREPTSKASHQRLIFMYAITLQREELQRQARRAMELQCEPPEAYVYLFLADDLPFSNGPELNQRWFMSRPQSEIFQIAEAIHTATPVKSGIQSGAQSGGVRTAELTEEHDRSLVELFELYPENLELLAWHIAHAVERGDVDRTVELLARLPPRADADYRFWRYAGWAQAQLDQPDQALADYQQALRLNPLDWTTRHHLADLRRELRQLDEVERLEKIVQKGYELTLALYLVPDARAVPENLLNRLADYAAECGDDLYATSLRRRLKLAKGAGGRSH